VANQAKELADLLDEDVRLRIGIMAVMPLERAQEAASLLRTQAARIAELEAEVERLRKPLPPEHVWQLWAQVCKVERPTVELVEAFARAIEAAKEG